jgi:hypothetical protein
LGEPVAAISRYSAVCNMLLQNPSWCCISENHNLNVKNWINYVEKYFIICVVSFTDNRIMDGCMVFIISVLLVIFQYQIFFFCEKLVLKPASYSELQRTYLHCTFPLLLLINLSVSI